MSTKHKQPFKVGQTLVGAKRGLNRTVTGVRGNTITWKNKNKTGKCSVRSLQSWSYKQ